MAISLNNSVSSATSSGSKDSSVFSPKKILLIKLGAVGDLVIASPFFESLRGYYPRSEIILLTGQSSFFTVQNNPNIDRLLITDDYSLFRRNSLLQPLEFLRVLLALKKEKFDMVFILHRAWQFNFLAFLTGASRRVGFARGNEGVLLTDQVIPQENRNEREIYLDLLRVADISVSTKMTSFYMSDEEKGFIDLFYERHRIDEDDILIAIAPGGGVNAKSAMYIKRWPIGNYIQLVKRIHKEMNFRVVVLGGPDDRAIAAQIEQEVPNIIDGSDLTVGEMASLLQRCNLFIGNDSGPLHVACAMDISSISLFGPTNPMEWAPSEECNTVIYKKVSCSPCFSQGFFPDCDHLSCLTSIQVEEVFGRVKSHFSSEKESSRSALVQ